jgi:uncharacterized membrane protein
MNAARLVHELGVIIWVGGMFFANFALRPSLAGLDPPQRLPLLLRVFTRFFSWAGLAIVAVLGSGLAMVALLGGMSSVGTAVHVMIALAALMIIIYGALVAGPYVRLRKAIDRGDLPSAGQAVGRIRSWVAVNLALGLATVVVAVLGHRG